MHMHICICIAHVHQIITVLMYYVVTLFYYNRHSLSGVSQRLQYQVISGSPTKLGYIHRYTCIRLVLHTRTRTHIYIPSPRYTHPWIYASKRLYECVGVYVCVHVYIGRRMYLIYKHMRTKDAKKNVWNYILIKKENLLIFYYVWLCIPNVIAHFQWSMCLCVLFSYVSIGMRVFSVKVFLFRVQLNLIIYVNSIFSTESIGTSIMQFCCRYFGMP